MYNEAYRAPPPINDAKGGHFFCPLRLKMQQSYHKPHLPLSKQIDLLRRRGMSFNDEKLAQDALLHLNYYRMRGYWITFEKPDCKDHSFKEGTRFTDVLALYHFDEELRNCLLYYLGKLEISIRATFAYYLSATLEDPLAYREGKYFAGSQNWRHSEALEKLDQAFQKSRERFAKVLRAKYLNPPVWAATEVMQFGQLVHWLVHLYQGAVVTKMGQAHGIVPSRTFRSFIRSAAVLRNICAHHGRLAYRELSMNIRKPTLLPAVKDSWQDKERRPYNLLTLLSYVMQQAGDDSGLKTELQALSDKHTVSLTVLGFPENWEDRPVWASRS